jgi:hypothetical protein
MTMPNKYVYVIISNKTNKMLVEDDKCPIYWNRKVAKERVQIFPDCRIEPVLEKELLKHILTYPR